MISRTKRWEESQAQARNKRGRNWALVSTVEELIETCYGEPMEFMDKMNYPMALLAVIDNTMYLHQTMKQPD